MAEGSSLARALDYPDMDLVSFAGGPYAPTVERGDISDLPSSWSGSSWEASGQSASACDLVAADLAYGDEVASRNKGHHEKLVDAIIRELDASTR